MSTSPTDFPETLELPAAECLEEKGSVAEAPSPNFTMKSEGDLPPASVEVPEVEREASDNDELPEVKALPTLQFYQKSYANSCGNNDVKAVKLFKEYESREKLQRLRGELFAISKGRASDEVCARILGLTRRTRFNGFDKWAFAVLNAMNSKG